MKEHKCCYNQNCTDKLCDCQYTAQYNLERKWFPIIAIMLFIILFGGFSTSMHHNNVEDINEDLLHEVCTHIAGTEATLDLSIEDEFVLP